MQAAAHQSSTPTQSPTLAYMCELANYGEYSGDPSEEFTYLYAKTILDLMTRKPHPKGKFLLIGGGIANFTDVAATFKGIINALKEYQKEPAGKQSQNLRAQRRTQLPGRT